MTKALGVGIVGASAERGWAKISHVPAIQNLAGLDLVAVASGSQSKADAAAQAFGAKRGYADANELFRDPDVNIVSVCVKVPEHRDLVLAALAEGKHIYCEWPLGRNVAETELLAKAADAAGVQVAIGLQTRANPAVLRAQDLLASGAIGRVLSARILSEAAAFGPQVEPAMTFAENPDNGVTLVSVQGGHTLDLAVALLGDLADLTALTTTQFPNLKVGDPPSQQTRSIPDHLLVQARVAGGSALSLEVAGGRPPESTPFRMEVTGETSTLALLGGAPRGFQSGLLQLLLNGRPQQVELGELSSLPEPAVNVGGLYAALRQDILSGTSTTPDFAHALRLASLLDRVLQSAEQRQAVEKLSSQ